MGSSYLRSTHDRLTKPRFCDRIAESERLEYRCHSYGHLRVLELPTAAGTVLGKLSVKVPDNFSATETAPLGAVAAQDHVHNGKELRIFFLRLVAKGYWRQDIGGGLGVRYTENDPEIDIEDNIRQVAEYFKKKVFRQLLMQLVWR